MNPASKAWLGSHYCNVAHTWRREKMLRKTDSQPMSLEDIEQVLISASQISNHRRFVIAGSLCVIVAVMRPPAEMSMSRDLGMYPQLDPGRCFVEIAAQLGEGSDFHKTHGFYADPITPKLLASPEGWEARLAPISFPSGVVGYFMDPNDVAVGKLVRAQENDIQWVSAGLNEGIVNPEIIRQRLRATSNITHAEAVHAGDVLQLAISESEKTDVIGRADAPH